MKKAIFVSLAIGTSFMFSGCATIMSGKTQKVKFISDKPAKIEIDGQTLTTPATVEIRRENNSKIVKVKCDGKEKQIVLKKKVNPWFGGNLLFGGLLGSTTDYASDAMWQYDDTVKVDCNK